MITMNKIRYSFTKNFLGLPLFFEEIKKDIMNSKQICIKINLCFFKTYETGATTSVNFVENIIEQIKLINGDAKIIICEADASVTKVKYLFEWLGYHKLLKKENVSLVNLSKAPFVNVKDDRCFFLNNLKISKVLVDSDLLINLSKLKTHSLTTISCSLKNIFGALPRKNKFFYHKNLNRIIVDSNIHIKSHLNIVDGIIGMEGVEGPIFGIPKKCNIVIWGRNPVQTDAFCAESMGFKPKNIEHLRLAKIKKLGEFKYDNDIPSIHKFQFNSFKNSLLKIGNRLK